MRFGEPRGNGVMAGRTGMYNARRWPCHSFHTFTHQEIVMASRTCPTCGLAVPADSRFCRNCGTSLAASTGAVDAPAPPPPYDLPQPGYGAPPAAGMSPLPAYGGPPAINASASWSSDGVWRQNDGLVMHRAATLPDRCIKCNRPANGRVLTKRFAWHHPAWYLLIFAGLLIYAIAALIVRKQVVLHLPLCDEHFS